MDAKQTTPEQIAPETSENSAPEVGIESSPIAESVLSSPTITPQADISNITATIPVTGEDPDPGKTVTPEEVSDLTSSGTEKADGDWIGKVKSVIKEDEGQPFKEETDAESLNENYMKKRFNVDVDAPMEEK